MTQTAILADRGVLPQIRATLLGVALVARVILGEPNEFGCGLVIVESVAAAAIHLSFEQWMAKCLQRFAALQLMTVVTYFGLSRYLQYGVARRMADVTVGTGDFVVVVRTAMPAESSGTIVTVEAHRILGTYACNIVGFEIEDRWTFLAAPHPWRVCAAWSMAGLALQLPAPERTLWISGYRMLGLEYGQRDCIVMAGDTGICAFPAVWHVACCFACSLCPANRRQNDTDQKQEGDSIKCLQTHSYTIPSQK